MGEPWKDMSLYYSAAAAAAYRRRAAYLQEYLAAPHEPPPPHTALTLEFTYLGAHAHAGSNSTSSGDMPDPFAFSFPDTNNRRDAAAAGGDLRQWRMIKNRASAARSRARKQAYTNELELELARLRRDNRMLIERQQDLHHARMALPAQAPGGDGSTLQRCRSAPAP